MTYETDDRVYVRAGHAPWREILRQRWTGRLDRALVLRDRHGEYRLLGRGRRDAVADPSPHEPVTGTSRPGWAPSPGRLRGYECAFHVRLGEETATRRITLPTAHGSEAVDARVLWWVHDPVQVVRAGVTDGWNMVCRSLGHHLRRLEGVHAGEGRGFGAADIQYYLSAPQYLNDSGLSYRITGVHAREAEDELRLGQSGEVGLPYSWSANRREEYEFCAQAVRGGPVWLAALWLHRHPDQVQEVLDWSVSNRELLKGVGSWEDEVAGLLGKLTAQEQTELSELLRDRLARLGRPVPARDEAAPERSAVRPEAGPTINGWTGPQVSNRPV